VQSLSSLSLASESTSDVGSLDISIGGESGIGEAAQTPSTPVFSAIPNIPSVQVSTSLFPNKKLESINQIKKFHLFYCLHLDQ